MGKAVRKARAFIGGIFRGIESPVDTFATNIYAYPHASEQEAMRSDWIRVGDHIRGAMKKIDVKATPSSAR